MSDTQDKPRAGRWSSRKLWVCVLGMVLATWLRSRGLLADESLTTVLLAGMLGYPAANVAQRAVEAKQ